MSTEPKPLSLSVVVPVFNESGNVAPLITEIIAALRTRIDFEIIYVDDCSKDDTINQLIHQKASVPELRVLTHLRQSGQSTALRSGIRRARGLWIATLDGDGQNNPADIPMLLAARENSPSSTKMFAGWRVQRSDSWSKRVASTIANSVRSKLLRDATPDTGCGLKLFERAAYLELPYFDHMHRYLPALMQRAGYQTLSVPVSHRARTEGVSKYTNLGRLWVGLSDLRGVAWLIRRAKITDVREE